MYSKQGGAAAVGAGQSCLGGRHTVPTAGGITEFGTPTAKSDPEGIVFGSDGNIWFIEPQAVARITTHERFRFSLTRS